VGRIQAKLREHDLDRNTLIFFTSDNGAPLKGKKDVPINSPGGAWDGSLNDPLNGEKGTLLEGGIRVPFLVSWPAGLPAGTVYDRPVSSLDFAATALAVSGQPHDAKLDGVNLVPFLQSEKVTDAHASLFWRFWGQTAVRAGDWKLVRLGSGTEMLFNLVTDIGETNNMLAARPEKAAELRELLARWESQMLPAKPRASGLNAQEQEWFAEQAGRKTNSSPPAANRVLPASAP
jgi:arylsulfatase A-like enzyme